MHLGWPRDASGTPNEWRVCSAPTAEMFRRHEDICIRRQTSRIVASIRSGQKGFSNRSRPWATLGTR